MSGDESKNGSSRCCKVGQIRAYPKVVKTVVLEVKRTKRIRNLKAMVREKEGISESLQQLFFAGDQLRDDQTLVDYGIKKNSTLHLEAPDTTQSIKSLIHIKEGIEPDRYTLMHAGKLLEDSMTLASLNILGQTTVYLAIAGSMMDFPIQGHVMCYAGKQLEDCKSLVHYNIKEGSTLEICTTIQIFVRTWNGGSLTLDVLPSDTSRDVNEKETA
ncbi:uncharacterized protein LOC131151269 [Malania oleifera]|uniref:uncharacterized protein LOC131151269 n=1 Tax=Malania oleifera TaxID=397392 RepID=UPI0025AE2370|nr:uncharacterized protein LOC131151269 [Malania oleifera]